MINILDRITQYRLERNWTEYKLAVKSGLPQSTISSWYRKDMLPSLSSLEKICKAFDIPISQFFVEEETSMVELTKEQYLMLVEFNRMDSKQQNCLIDFLKAMKDSK